MDNWTKKYIGLAKHISSWSKDPSTKVGAVIARPDNTPVSFGFNGFPKHHPDWPYLYENREYKYKHILHAEENAMAFARESLQGCNVYLTHPPCCKCLANLAQRGIASIYFPTVSDEWKERWSYDEVRAFAKKLGVILVEEPYEECQPQGKSSE